MAASTAAVDGGGLRLSTAPFLAFMARGGATAADDGCNGSERRQQFIPFIFYSLATTSFIVLYCR